MAVTYEPIATITVAGSSTTDITFSSIPSTYTDIRLVLVTTTNGATGLTCRFNNVSTTTYSFTNLQGSGVSVGTGNATSVNGIELTATGASSTIPSLYTLDMFSYAGSANKTSLLTSEEDRSGSGTVNYQVNLWRSTAAINQITITTNSGTNYIAGTTATIYGIKAA